MVGPERAPVDKPDNKKTAVWRQKRETMTEQDKQLERGRDCLSILRHYFDDAIQTKQFDEADRLVHEYAGAALMLHGLELISGEDYYSWTEVIHNRYRRARYPGAYPEGDS